MTYENVINKNLIESLPKKFLYHNNTIVSEDFGRFIKNLISLKNNVENERILQDHHGITPHTLATRSALKPTRATAQIPGLRFRLRLAAGFSQHHPSTTKGTNCKQQKNARSARIMSRSPTNISLTPADPRNTITMSRTTKTQTLQT
jgi:hypothetical protein